MKPFLSLLLLIILCNCQKSKDNFSVSNGVLIENVTIISPNKNGEIETYIGHILTNNHKIVYTGKAIPVIDGNFKTIDGKGKYAIPGLIDSHVHLNNIAGINFRQRKSNKILVKEYFDRLPKNFLYFGYTTLIDVDNYAPELINNLKKARLGPEIYTCPQKVSVMDDFEMFINEIPQANRYKLDFLHDKYNKEITYPDSINLDKHSVAQIISNASQEDNNICIKTLYEDASSGFIQTWELPSPQIMKDLVADAHQEGFTVIMHATSFEGQNFALKTGVDVIAHAMWNWTANPQEYLSTNLPETHKALLLKIAKAQLGYQPTIRVILGEKDILDNTFKDNVVLQSLYSPNYLSWLQSEEAQWSRNRILARPQFLKRMNPDFFNPIRNHFSSDEEMFQELYKSMEIKIQKVVKLLSEHDANFLFSTDNGAMNMHTHPPGYNGYLEMQHWFDAGITLEQIFKAATYNNAKAFGLIDAVGTISKNRTANILILNSNPLKTIKAYNDIKHILIGGEIINRESLSAKYISK